jgi:hypothetical protein
MEAAGYRENAINKGKGERQMQKQQRPLATLSVALLCIALTACEQKKEASMTSTQNVSGDINASVLHARAVQAVIWGMPVVNLDLMRQEMLTKTSGKVNQVVYWGRPLDSHNQTLTPNPDALYFMAFLSTKDGPIVLDLPPGDEKGSFNGNIVTTWQMPLEDAGLLGYDHGKGGKYLVLPPGYKDKVPSGYIPLQSDTYGGYLLFRANFKSHSDSDVAASVAYGKQLKVYPLSQAAHPADTVFTDAQNVEYDSRIKYDWTFFEHLDRMIQEEPWLDRDKGMIDQLRYIGIEKGKPFNPSEYLKSQLTSAAQEGHAWLEKKYDAGLPPFFSDKSRWTYPATLELIKAQQNSFTQPDAYPVDDRGMGYSYAYVGIKRLGAGQFYMISIRDKDGNAFEGGKNYKLTVPPNAPVKQYWSVTAYDRETHALIQGMSRPSRSSQMAELQKHADGSVDIYFGPKAPDGKDTNWLPTDPNRKFELMFRLYAPTEALFQKQWILPDVEKVP